MSNFTFNALKNNRKLSTVFLFAALLLTIGKATAQCDSNPPGDDINQPYGQDSWIGYVYTDYTVAQGGIPSSPFSATYRGYVTAPDVFENNYGAGAISGDSLCGSYDEVFAVRYKMKKTLAPGFYRFTVGGDDGVRLSLDGGNTFVTPTNSWTNHSYLTYEYYLQITSETEINFVLEWYENDTLARLSFAYTPFDCYASAPTEVAGTVIYSCNTNTTLIAGGGTTGTATTYQWGTGNTAGQNITGGNTATLVVTQPGSYWVRRHMGDNCNTYTDALFFNVTTSGNVPGNPAVYGNNTWRVYGYNGNDAAFPIAQYKGYYVQNIDSETNFGFDTALAWNTESTPSATLGWEGCQVGVNNNDFSYTHKRQGLPCGEYTIVARKWDDNIQVFVNGVLQFSHEGWSGYTLVNEPVGTGTFILGPDSQIDVTLREWGGWAHCQVDIVPVSKQPTGIDATAETTCGQSTTLTATGGNLGSAGIYQWGTGTMGENIIAGETGASITVTPTVNTTYWVRIVFNNCNSGQGVSTNIVVDNTWTGAENHEWHNAANWTCGVPAITDLVVIPVTQNNPEVTTGNAVAKTLTVITGAGVTVKTGGTLTVQGAVVANGTFTVQNNAALIQLNDNAANTGIATVNRNSNPLFRLDYTLWGSPVQGQQLLDFSPYTSTNPARFYTYGLFTNGTQEGYVTADYNANFIPGTGYLIRTPNSLPLLGNYNQGTTPYVHEGAFTGALNNGIIEVPVGSMVNHYMAVANPYASPISVKEFFEDNIDVIQDGNGIYFWRKSNNSTNSTYGHLTLAGYAANNALGGNIGDDGYYDVEDGENIGFNENWIISPGQGFLVKVKSTATATDKIVFNNGMRRPAGSVESGQPFFRTLNTNSTNTIPAVSRWKIDMTGANNVFAQTLVAYIPQATLELDYGYDAKILADGNARIYSKGAASSLAIQARPSFTDTDVVPLGFVIAAPGQYTLSLNHMDGVFAQDQEIYIKDNLLGTVSNLKEADYTFTTDAGTFDTRFEVIYQPQGELGTGNPSPENTVMVYQNNGTIHVATGNIEMTGLTLYDVRGRKLYEKTGIHGTEASINSLGVAKQVIIVEIDTVKGKVSKKIVY